MFKKIITGVIAFQFLFMLGGYLLPYIFCELYLKHEAKEKIQLGIQANEFRLISVHKIYDAGKLKFEDEEEFEFDGNMYDIVKSVEAGDSIHYYCYCDSKETKIKNNFALNSGNGKDKKLKEILFRFINNRVLAIPISATKLNLANLFHKTNPTKSFQTYISFDTDTPHPPPKIDLSTVQTKST